jgi:TPR repeat protein
MTTGLFDGFHVQRKGDSDAMNNLALMYENGQGPQEFAQAREWHMKGIEQVNNLALMDKDDHRTFRCLMYNSRAILMP